MFLEASQSLVLLLAAAFLLGWIAGKLSSRFGDSRRIDARDPRDGRIRSLEAEHRVAKVDAEKVREELEHIRQDLQEEKNRRLGRDKALQEHAEMVDTLRQDLKDSVIKTRELRSELTDRAEQEVRSQVKLREVETELSVAHASTDMIATGVLDYSLAPEKMEKPLRRKVKPVRQKP
jgi:chromosome segregation ATPase